MAVDDVGSQNSEDIDNVPNYLREAAKLLPAWFTPRMVDDNWFFGLLTVTGHVICISTINSVTQAADGTIWLDADLLTEKPGQFHKSLGNPILAPTSRTDVSINASHIVAAFELADT